MVVQEDKPIYVTKPKTYTLQEYLAKEVRSVHKHEFHSGQIIRMPGISIKHNLIAMNIAIQIGAQVEREDLSFSVLGGDQKIYIAAIEKVLYADVVVVYEAIEHADDNELLLTNPLLIVEVASKSTKNYDRSEKFMHYRMLPSLKEYVLVEQDKPQIESFFLERHNTWNIVAETDIEKSITFRSLNIALDLRKIYKGVF